MELIDTHCHLTFEDYDDNMAEVIARSRAACVTQWITVGTNIGDCEKAIALTEQFPNMYAAVGIHPHYAKDVTPDMLQQLETFAKHEKVVAIGETGLDFHYNFSKQHPQERLFAAHLKIASEMHLPVIIHSRKAFDATVSMLEQFGRDVEKVVFHCFSGSAEQAKIVLRKGYYVSFTGVVTFKNANKTRLAAQAVPLDRLMLETDCPYMSPEPVRKQKTNEPALLIHTAQFLAELKEADYATFAQTITQTTKSFFNLPQS